MPYSSVTFNHHVLNKLDKELEDDESNHDLMMYCGKSKESHGGCTAANLLPTLVSFLDMQRQTLLSFTAFVDMGSGIGQMALAWASSFKGMRV